MSEGNMLVARLHGANDLRLDDEPMPLPGPDEALVRVTAVGVCGSDIHWLTEGRIGKDSVDAPMVLGHECAGVIESGPRRGEHVAIDPAIACGYCEYCQEGNPNLCVSLRFAGHAPIDGAMRECIAWPSRCLIPLPAGLSDTDGAMLEPLGVGLYAVDLGAVKPGMTIGVCGCGPIGLSVLQVARAAGAAWLCAADLSSLPHRLQAAQALGASVFEVNAGREAGAILAATNQRGVDVAFEAAGDPEAVEAAVAMVKPGGRVVLIGIPSDDRIAFTAATARRKDLTINVLHRMKNTYPRAIRMAERGLVNVRSLVTHRFPLKEAAQAFASAAKREGLKVVIEP